MTKTVLQDMRSMPTVVQSCLTRDEELANKSILVTKTVLLRDEENANKKLHVSKPISEEVCNTQLRTFRCPKWRTRQYMHSGDQSCLARNEEHAIENIQNCLRRGELHAILNFQVIWTILQEIKNTQTRTFRCPELSCKTWGTLLLPKLHL